MNYRHAIASLLLLATSPAFSSEATLPHTFTSGTKAKAAEVNANFNAVKNAVNDNHSRLNTLESDVADLKAAPSTAHKQIVIVRIATDEVVGVLIDPTPRSKVLISNTGYLFTYENAADLSNNRQVFFTGINCTGSAYYLVTGQTVGDAGRYSFHGILGDLGAYLLAGKGIAKGTPMETGTINVSSYTSAISTCTNVPDTFTNNLYPVIDLPPEISGVPSDFYSSPSSFKWDYR